MNQNQICNQSPALAAVKAQFDHWRRTRERRSKTPKPLLDAARALLVDYSPSQLTQALGMSYTTLKQCADTNPAHREEQQAESFDFVEALLPSAKKGELPQSGASRCVLALHTRQGHALTVKGMSEAGTLTLIERFMR